MKFAPDVEIAALRGGYVLRTREFDPDTNEVTEFYRTCVTAQEAAAHVVRSLESLDRSQTKDYEKIERNMNGA